MRVLFEGHSYAEAAAGFAVSTRTVAKWVRRFKDGGVAALEDGSSRPGAPPHQTPPAVVALIRLLRVEHGLPAWAIGRALRVPRSTVSAWLRRLGVQRLPAPPPGPCPAVRMAAARRSLARRYQAAGAHWLCRPSDPWRPAARDAGDWVEYVHVGIDDHTRLAYVEVLADQLGPTCAAFLQRAVAWFRARGITTRRVMSDNGSGYVSRAWRTTCEALRLRHLRTRAYTPRTNGKAERFIQTLLREWAYARPYASSQERRVQLRPYVQFYNRQRPHASLDYQAPWSRLTSAA